MIECDAWGVDDVVLAFQKVMGLTKVLSFVAFSAWLVDLANAIFFQAEDGIRYLTVTGVQTCALPISTKNGPTDIDESTDTYDTIEWLVKNVPDNNGRVGMWGISYPGFYASAGMIDAHPALKAVSPQAPIADWWYDDFHHNGALFLPHAFNFLSSFGRPRPAPTPTRGSRLDHGTPDGYRFFLELGSLANVNAKWFHGEV